MRGWNQYPESFEGASNVDALNQMPEEFILFIKEQFEIGKHFYKEIDEFKKLLGFQDEKIERLFDELHYAILGGRMRLCVCPRQKLQDGLKYIHSSRDSLLRCRYRSLCVKKILDDARLSYMVQCYNGRKFPKNFSLNGGLDRKITYEFFDFVITIRSFFDKLTRFLMWSVGRKNRIHYSSLQEELIKLNYISGVDKLICIDRKDSGFKKFINTRAKGGLDLRNVIAHDDYVPFVNVTIGGQGVIAIIDSQYRTEFNRGEAELFFSEIVEEMIAYVEELVETMVIDWREIVET